jgi:hypothetical protein
MQGEFSMDTVRCLWTLEKVRGHWRVYKADGFCEKSEKACNEKRNNVECNKTLKITYSGHNAISTHNGIIFCENFEVLAKHFSNFSSLNIEVKCMENTINEE